MINQKTEIAKKLINCGRLSEAENILLSLEDKFSLFELAKLRKIQGNNLEAERLYLKSLSVPTSIKSHIDSNINVELGRIYASVGKIEKSKEYYEKGLDIVCSEKNIYKELGELYLRFADSNYNNYSEAKKYLKKSVELFPKDIMTNIELAVVYRNLGEDSEAKKILNRLLVLKEIKSSKYLYNTVLNEYEILMKKEYLESKPREMRISLTNNCNIGCRYCDIWKNRDWQISNERVDEIVKMFS